MNYCDIRIFFIKASSWVWLVAAFLILLSVITKSLPWDKNDIVRIDYIFVAFTIGQLIACAIYASLGGTGAFVWYIISKYIICQFMMLLMFFILYIRGRKK